MAQTPPDPAGVNTQPAQDPNVGSAPGEKPLTSGVTGFVFAYLVIVSLSLLTGLYYAWNSDKSGQDQSVSMTTDSIEPDHGPVAGGTRVRVIGKTAFPAGAKLRFDGVEVATDPISRDSKLSGTPPATSDTSAPQATSEPMSSDGTQTKNPPNAQAAKVIDELLATSPKHDAGKVIVDVLDKSAGKSVVAFSYTYGSAVAPFLFLLVILAGGLGASLHALRSFYWYAGECKLVRSWVWMYLLLPLTGALMATVFYLIISAGLMSPEQASNPLIAVGIAALVGMFSPQAAEKLKSIAEATFAPASKGSNTLKVAAVAPSAGSTAGGTSVTIHGDGFAGTPTVLFDSSPAKSVTVTSPTLLTAVTPQHTVGPVDVTVKTATTTATLTKAFTYNAAPAPPANGAGGPGASPAIGPAAGGTNVALTGTGFGQDAVVTFGGTPATAVTVTDSTTLSAVTPAHAVGKVDVVVTSGGKTVLTLPNGFEYQ